jgi:hypothetical protein
VFSQRAARCWRPYGGRRRLSTNTCCQLQEEKEQDRESHKTAIARRLPFHNSDQHKQPALLPGCFDTVLQLHFPFEAMGVHDLFLVETQMNRPACKRSWTFVSKDFDNREVRAGGTGLIGCPAELDTSTTPRILEAPGRELFKRMVFMQVSFPIGPQRESFNTQAMKGRHLYRASPDGRAPSWVQVQFVLQYCNANNVRRLRPHNLVGASRREIASRIIRARIECPQPPTR